MNCRDFQAVLSPWIDGELPHPQAQELRAHLLRCSECAARAEAERAFEARLHVAASVPSDPDRLKHLMTKARDSATGSAAVTPARQVRRGFVLRHLRALTAAAASITVAVGGAWYLCIPPFECPYLQAVEIAASRSVASSDSEAQAPAGTVPRVDVPDEILGHPRRGAADHVPVTIMGRTFVGLRARYEIDGAQVAVVWSDAMGREPSFRRHTTRDDQEWWIAYEDGRTIVAYASTTTGALCTVVGAAPESRLLSVASQLRAGSP